jgi:hypothetical protein
LYKIPSFIHLACAECDDSLPFSGASSIPLCYVMHFFLNCIKWEIYIQKSLENELWKWEMLYLRTLHERHFYFSYGSIGRASNTQHLTWETVVCGNLLSGKNHGTEVAHITTTEILVS